MELQKAKSIAESLRAEIEPFCAQVIIAGSIRRGKPEVKDIEIVAVPKFLEKRIETGNLFEPYKLKKFNPLFNWATEHQTAIQWIKPGARGAIPWQIKPDGKYWRGLIFKGVSEPIKLDLFLVEPKNWGVIATIRTGPAEFSQSLVTVIKHQTPFQVEGGNLTRKDSGEIIPCETEEDFFRNAGIVFVPVQIRESANPYQILHLKK